MNNRELFQSLGPVDDNLIREADRKPEKRGRPWKRWAAAAACVAGLSGGGAGLLRYDRELPAAITPGRTDGSGVYVEPPVMTNGDGAASMIGMIVYGGKIYAQTERLSCGEETLATLQGTFLGTATGEISEWSGKEDYGREFASTVRGVVFTVNGYDPGFRICIPRQAGGETILEFYDCLNGITLYTGADLYDDRLHLPENWTSLEYLTHDAWYYGDNYDYKTPDLTEGQITDFIQALCAAPFENWDYTTGKAERDIYDYDYEQAHLYFRMSDGTTVALRLFENGCVGYQYLADRVFVRMEGEAFDTIFAACTK